MTKTMKWHPMSEAEAQSITNATKSPGLVYSLPIEEAPSNLQQMPGARSYFVSDYLTTIAFKDGLKIGNEIVIERTEEKLTKAYNFAVATSSDGKVYFNGPYKDFEGHNINSASSVPIVSLFGHSPFTVTANTK